MQPAARFYAVIELLEAIEESLAKKGAAADALVQRYFRQRRYAGSKDRRAVIEDIYAILRGRALYAWALDKEQADRSARHLALAFAIHQDRDLDALFAGGEYGPETIDKYDQALIDAIKPHLTGATPDWVEARLPKWLYQELKERYGDALVAEMQALDERAPTDIRVNARLTDAAEVIKSLGEAGFEAAPIAGLDNGLRLKEANGLTATQAFKDGHFEVQDAAAQIAALLCDAGPGAIVIEMCAGAGGKTLAIADTMANKGQIYALDTSKKKLEELKTRAKRANVHNLQIKRYPSEGPKREKILVVDLAWADRVLLDVPCSGSGTWRRNPELKWRLDRNMLASLTKVQDQLLAEAADLVKPGGRLVYMTCSVLAAENDDRVADFLKHRPAFEAIDYKDASSFLTSEQMPASAAETGRSLQLTPARNETDGFFIAILQKKDEQEELID